MRRTATHPAVRYVRLRPCHIHADRVLAVCAVARAVWPIDDLAGWHAFGTGSGFKDVDLIKNALDDIQISRPVIAMSRRRGSQGRSDGTSFG